MLPERQPLHIIRYRLRCFWMLLSPLFEEPLRRLLLFEILDEEQIHLALLLNRVERVTKEHTCNLGASMTVEKSKRAIYQLIRSNITHVLDALLPVTAEKRKALLAMKKELVLQQELQEQLRVEKDPVKVAKLVERIAKLNEGTREIIAFKGRDNRGGGLGQVGVDLP